ncbi:MAG: 16S rRNA processing protein RimM [Bacteroidetes bacterium GWF2_33_16]|nr:MAG: 16S rRNA processing protein RimM [Bacteroidetes bacterium GWE2_32_14]OFY03678.1 MAG: 16S rRNA processing protein RimM [Bacteroidetes bacterium GWF2_33_16]
MLKKDDHYLLGSLSKTTGVKGEIIVRFNDDVHAKMNKMESVFIEVDGKLVPFFIESYKEKSANTAIIKFEEITSEQKAQDYLGAAFYLPAEYKKLLEQESNDFIDVTGYILKDQNLTVIGTVVDYIDISGNPLLQVKTTDKEILIPAHDDLIIEVDDDEKYIVIELADGIMDLDE